MKDIRESQGRSEQQIKTSYRILDLIFSFFLLCVITYNIINVLI